MKVKFVKKRKRGEGAYPKFLALFAAIVAFQPVAAQEDTTCPSRRDCNTPLPFSELQSTTDLPTIVASSGITDDVKAKVNNGHQRRCAARVRRHRPHSPINFTGVSRMSSNMKAFQDERDKEFLET